MASAGAQVQPPQQQQQPSPPALQIKLLSPTAKPPTRGSAFAAGYDLYASKPTTVPARGKALVDTDISIAVPADTYGRVAPRSGLASKHSIDVGAGVIDADYRGPVKVLLFNLGDADFKVEVGERIAQLIVERVSFFFPCSSCPVGLRCLWIFLWVGGFSLASFLVWNAAETGAQLDSALLGCFGSFWWKIHHADLFLFSTDLYPGGRCRGRTRGDCSWRRWLWLDRWLWWHWHLNACP